MTSLVDIQPPNNSNSISKLVLATAWYRSRTAKFDSATYIGWMRNFLPGVRRFYLVVFTDKASLADVQTAYPGIDEDPRIRIVILEKEHWAGYAHRDAWIDNHRRNMYLNQRVDWDVNMMWSEKTMFVKRVVDNLDRYFPQLAVAANAELATVDLVGWCDIGYFRDSAEQDLVRQWPDPTALQVLSRKKIHYGMVLDPKTNAAHHQSVNALMQIVSQRDAETGLPVMPIPPTQICFAGGFFLCHPSQIDDWHKTYTDTLLTYFRHGALVKDDQIILTHCIFREMRRFQIHRLDEVTPTAVTKAVGRFSCSPLPWDRWFLFRYLLVRPFPQITVLMPLYNGIEYLAESVGSVIAQTYPRWNIIIGVNGYDEPRSPVWQEADAMVRNHPTWAPYAQRGQIQVWDVRFPEGVAKGKGAALNLMVQRIEKDCVPSSSKEERHGYCTSTITTLPVPDYYAILDVDDVWLPDKLRQQVCNVPDFDSYDVIGTQCVYWSTSPRHPLNGVQPKIPLGAHLEQRHDFYTQGNPIINSSVIIRRTKELLYWDDQFRGLEDYDLWIRMWRVGRCFYNVPTVLVKHRLHEDSAFNANGQNAGAHLSAFLQWQKNRNDL